LSALEVVDGRPFASGAALTAAIWSLSVSKPDLVTHILDIENEGDQIDPFGVTRSIWVARASRSRRMPPRSRNETTPAQIPSDTAEPDPAVRSPAASRASRRALTVTEPVAPDPQIGHKTPTSRTRVTASTLETQRDQIGL
jgi:hypothetical protein